MRGYTYAPSSRDSARPAGNHVAHHLTCRTSNRKLAVNAPTYSFVWHRILEGMDYAPIIPGLFVGSHPQAVDDIERLLRDSAITAVLNLQTDDDMRSVKLDWPPLAAHYRASGIDLLRFPIKEEQTEMREKFPDCVRDLAGLLRAGRVVYLHCTAGIGRSPTVAVGYLHWCLGWQLDVAVSHVKCARQCSPHLEALRQAEWNPIERHR